MEDDDNMFHFDYSPEVLAMVSQAKKSHTHTLRDHHLDRFCLENHVLKQPLTIGLVLLLNLLETDRNALPLTTFE